MTNMNKCLVCGLDFFQVDSRGRDKQTCSKICQHKYRLDYMKEWRAKQKDVKQ